MATAGQPIVVTLERAWRHLMDVMRYAQPQRVRSAQLWTSALHHRMRRGG